MGFSAVVGLGAGAGDGAGLGAGAAVVAGAGAGAGAGDGAGAGVGAQPMSTMETTIIIASDIATIFFIFPPSSEFSNVPELIIGILCVMRGVCQGGEGEQLAVSS